MFWELLRSSGLLPWRSQVKRGKRRRPNCLPIRLRLETLEDRIVLSGMAGQIDNGPNNSEVGVILQSLPVLQGDISVVQRDILTSAFGNLLNDIGVYVTDLTEVFEGQVPTHAAPITSTSTPPTVTPSPLPAPAAIYLGAFKLNNISFSKGGATLQGDATLPIVGSVHLSGTYKGANDYSMNGEAPSASFGEAKLSNVAIRLSNSGLSVTGNAILPGMSQVQLEGDIQDSSHYSLAASLPSVALGDFKLSNDTITLNSSGLTVQGSLTLPQIGYVPLIASIQSANSFSINVNKSQEKGGSVTATQTALDGQGNLYLLANSGALYEVTNGGLQLSASAKGF